jgi:hypothetical protein
MQLPNISIVPFDASKLKIARARQHLQELETSVSDFLAHKPFAVLVEKPEGMPDYLDFVTWVARFREEVPHEWSPIIGDIIHNLRAALDVMACDLVRLNGKSATGVYFPFARSASDLAKQIKGKHIDRAGPQVVDEIEKLQPYKGGNLALRAIHDLDIVDKHQSLIAVAGSVVTAGVTLYLSGHPNQIPQWHMLIEKEGQRIVTMPRPANIPIGTEVPSLFDLVFSQVAGSFSGQKIIPTLHNFVQTIEGVVDLFRTRFHKPIAGPSAT